MNGTKTITPSVKENLNPSDFVDTVLEQSRTFFLSLYGESLFLLVRLDATTKDLQAELAGLTADDTELQGAQETLPDGLSFHTQTGLQSHQASGKRRAATSKTDLYINILMDRVRESPHIVVSLCKRKQEDAYMNRISVGRSRNKDIILRHNTVSKFHAWFEMDETGTLFVADAGSKNGTKVRGTLAEPRTLVRVDPGDEIVFGSINATYCPAEGFWEMVHWK
jgi:hypothetical protein